MHSSFHTENRRDLYARLDKGSIALVFSGDAPRQTNDQYYPFFADRNFLYLTGIPQNNSILMGVVGDTASDALFIPPPDLMAERWNGVRIKADEAAEISGITDIKYTKDGKSRGSMEFDNVFNRLISSGDYHTLYLPLVKFSDDEPDGPPYKMARYIKDRFPYIVIKDLTPHIKALRLIKKPCEIEAMRIAEDITKAGILAMMRAAKPGITEYELKAEFDYAVMKRGVLMPAYLPIISAGRNNFLIHYNAYTGKANDGDLVLNDVGAVWDNIMTDVSRAWPVNGRFSERQKLLYQCAYNSCEYVFSIIKPGMPMKNVDGILRKYTYELLKDIGLCKDWDDIGKYMWHGGAHHVGYDVHDTVGIKPDSPIAPGMVFCVDAGIYVEEWGIGFRLEDNCLVTKTGCENLSADIPRSIEDIEAVMG